MHQTRESVYDQDEYYGSDSDASRLSRCLNPLLGLLDYLRARAAAKSVKPQTKNALDVGAGVGSYLHFLRRFGFSVYGTTASQLSRDAAHRRFGIDLEFTESLPDSITQRQYDLVTYWHVFEHLKNPRDHVAKWRVLLGVGGKIIVEVPNVESVGAGLCFGSWLGNDSKHHINPMTLSQMSALFEEHGLRVRRVGHVSLKFSYVFLWSALLGYVFRGAYDFDRIMVILKSPVNELRRRPLQTLNALASLGYFFPIIFILFILGWISRRGEVIRMVVEYGGI